MNKEDLLKLNPQEATKFCVQKLLNNEWTLNQYNAVIKYYEENHNNNYLTDVAKDMFE